MSDDKQSKPKGETAGIVLENSGGAKLLNNTIAGFDKGVLAKNSPDVEFIANKIVSSEVMRELTRLGVTSDQITAIVAGAKAAGGRPENVKKSVTDVLGVTADVASVLGLIIPFFL